MSQKTMSQTTTNFFSEKHGESITSVEEDMMEMNLTSFLAVNNNCSTF